MERNRKKNHSGKLVMAGTNKRGRGESGDKAIWNSLLIGMLIAIGITALGLIGGASLFYGGVLAGSEGQYRWISVLIMILAVGAGSLWVLRSQKGKRKWWALAVVGLYFLLRIVLSGLLLPLL